MTEALFSLHRGDSPLLVNIPHAGTWIPEAVAERLSAEGRARVDTDWHIPRLYDFLPADVTVLQARYSRYVVDLNRPPDDAPLYPGQQGTGLCAKTSFRGEALYKEGCSPDAQETAERRERYWQPYHSVLSEEIERLRERHPAILLWDAHSIQSCLPRLFEGTLPDLNLGTANETSCGPAVRRALEGALAEQGVFSWVHNGRFTGGYNTRHYGDPENGVHAVQMEIAQRAYMSEYPDFEYNAVRAERLRVVLERLLHVAVEAV